MSILVIVEISILVLTAILLAYFVTELELPKSVIMWILIVLSALIIYARIKTGSFGNTINVVKTLLIK